MNTSNLLGLLRFWSVLAAMTFAMCVANAAALRRADEIAAARMNTPSRPTLVVCAAR